jgi:hypothetical protein
LLLYIMVQYLLLLEPVVLEQRSSHATGWTTWLRFPEGPGIFVFATLSVLILMPSAASC